MTSATTTSAATTSSSRAKSASEFSGGNLEPEQSFVGSTD